jgi:hypothetical protein
MRSPLIQLPALCRLVNDHAPLGTGPVLSAKGVPGVMVVETENVADLSAISRHYNGYLTFEWPPADVAASRAKRAAWAAQNEPVANARR